MNDRHKEKQPPHVGITLEDVYFVLFRRKWLIIVGCLMGIAGSVAVKFAWHPQYVSEAKIAVPYVLETMSLPSPNKDSTDVKPTSTGGDGIINSEMDILRSWDLARTVATNVGPTNILAKVGGGRDVDAAAGMIVGGLLVERPARGSMVINVSFQHPDPAVVQPVLRGLIESYKEKHAEIHRPKAVDDFLEKQTDTLRSSLLGIEGALRTARTNAGVISIEDAKKALSGEISKIRSELSSALAELAEHQAALAVLTNASPIATSASTTSTNQEIPPNVLANYKKLCKQVGSLEEEENDLSRRLADENPRLQRVRDELKQATQKKDELESLHPRLVGLGIPTSPGGPQAPDPSFEARQVLALIAKTNALNAQLESARKEAAKLDEDSVEIEQLQLRKDLD
jgi:uncharacterized protein involved in exopolysaccharide biosynthesis